MKMKTVYFTRRFSLGQFPSIDDDTEFSAFVDGLLVQVSGRVAGAYDQCFGDGRYDALTDATSRHHQVLALAEQQLALAEGYRELEVARSADLRSGENKTIGSPYLTRADEMEKRAWTLLAPMGIYRPISEIAPAPKTSVVASNHQQLAERVSP